MIVCLLVSAFGATSKTIEKNNVKYQDTLGAGKFLREVSIDYAWEFILAKKAKTTSKISKIREYATKVMGVCILANKDMQAFALKSGVTLADSSSVPANIRKAILARNNARSFDKNYLAAAISSHQIIIAKYEKAVLFTDTAISNMAKKHLLSLRRSLEMAKYFSKNIKNGKLITESPPKSE